jgi:exodeoxyribonuclease V alpha subunit
MNGDEASHEPGARAEGIVCTVVRAVYCNEDSGFTVVRCAADEIGGLTAVGPLLGVRPGDRLQLTGRWSRHPRYGRQLEVESFLEIHPSTLAGVQRFLASGRVRGIGPKTAERIVDHFGLATLDVLERDPDRLLEVKGIGRKTVTKVRTSWAEHRGVRRLMVFLSGHGVPPGIALKAHRRYGPAALEVIRDNPYRLAEEVTGVGFLTADRIARSLGLPADAPQRTEAAVLYALRRAAGEGHVFLPLPDLEETVRSLLDSSSPDVAAALEALEGRQRITRHSWVDEPVAVYLTQLAAAEEAVASHLAQLASASREAPEVNATRAITWYQQRAGIRLAAGQIKALETALRSNVVVITGGPGTGKTTLVRGLVQIFGRRELSIELAAPTGRAAKRLQEATGATARTIHRLLEFNPSERVFARNRQHPIDADLVVVDEVSMLDVELAARLLEAVPSGCRLVLVGDADQLPSVGPGNVLADVIASGAVPVVSLRHIFRQGRESLIVVNAHRVNTGQMPVLRRDEDLADFYLVARDDPGAAADTAIELVTRRIPARFGLDPVDDIQVLSPMHRGEMGVTELNRRLQELLVPDGTELRVAGNRFRVGDKVMQIRNNYDLDVFNGDIGRVTVVDPEDRVLVVSFDGRQVEVTHDHLEDLVPAYACTIHKAQGSEYPAVVMLIHHHHHVMLQRNLLYTAITRGRRLVVIVGSRRALQRAVRNAGVRRRNTRLRQTLRRRTDLIASPGAK